MKTINRTEFTGSWMVFLLLLVIFFPFAIVYYFAKRETVTEDASQANRLFRPSIKAQRRSAQIKEATEMMDRGISKLKAYNAKHSLLRKRAN